MRNGQKQRECDAAGNATDRNTQRFLTALATAQTRLEFDEECAVLLALEEAVAAAATVK